MIANHEAHDAGERQRWFVVLAFGVETTARAVPKPPVVPVARDVLP